MDRAFLRCRLFVVVLAVLGATLAAGLVAGARDLATPVLAVPGGPRAPLVALGEAKTDSNEPSTTYPARAYVTNKGDSTISVIETGGNSVVASFGLSAQPFGVAVSPDGLRAYVSLSSNQLSVIDTVSNSPIATVTVGASPLGVAISPDGSRVYVANDTSISIVDTSVNAVVATIPDPGRPYGLAITPDGTRLYVSNNVSSTVTVFDITSNSVMAQIALTVGTGPTGIAVAPDGAKVYVATSNGYLDYVRTSDNTVYYWVQLSYWGVPGNLRGVAVSPDGTKVYIADYGNGCLFAISGGITTYCPDAGGGAFGIAVSPDGAWVYVSNYNAGTVRPYLGSLAGYYGAFSVGSNPVAFGKFVGPPLAPRLQFAASGFSAAENAGGALITVTRAFATNGTVGVSYASGNGIALAGSDYLTTTGVLTFTNGVTTQAFTVPIVDDAWVERSETVTLTLSSATGGAMLGSPVTATLTILDNDRPYAFIPNSYSNTVSVVDTGSNAVVSTIGVGSGPQSVAVNGDGTRAYVLNYNDRTISIIDTLSQSVISTTSSAGSYLFGIAVNPNGSRLYLTARDTGYLYTMDTATGSIVASLYLSGCTYPEGVVVSPDNTKVYVACNGSGVVEVVDAGSNSVVRPVGTNGSPRGVAVSPDGSRVFASLVTDSPTFPGGAVASINTSTWQATVFGIGGGNYYPYGITLSPDGSRLYTANNGGTVSVIDANSFGVLASVVVGAGPYGISETPDGSRVYVANRSSGNLMGIDTASNIVVAATTVGTAPIAFGRFISPSPSFQAGNVAFGVPASSVLENAGSAPVTVTRQSGSNGAVTVAYATSDGAAIAARDYLTTTGTLTFTNGVTTQVITVPIIDRSSWQPSRSFTITLSNPTGGVTLVNPATATVTILDTYIPAAVQADFSASPLTGTAPLTVTFANLSSGDYDTLLWQFGDGYTSTITNPLHTYAAGRYTVTLSASGLGGADTMMKTSYITVTPDLTGVWTAMAPMPTIRNGLTVQAIGDAIYAVGGWKPNPNAYLSTLDRYNPISDTWTTGLAPRPEAGGHKANGVISGTLYEAGGTGWSGDVTSGYAYSPTTNSWSSIAPLPATRAFAASGATGGKLYVAGGRSSGAAQNGLYAYDPPSNSWTSLAPMAAPRFGAAGAVANGLLYVFGGITDTNYISSGVASVEIYSPSSNSWTAAPPMPSPRSFMKATTLNGLIYVVGGNDASGTVTGRVDVFDPVANAWSSGPDMKTPRAYLGLASVGNTLYAIGGYDASFATVATNEAYTPTAGLTTAVISGSVTLQGRAVLPPADAYSIPLRVQLFAPGTATPALSTTVNTDLYAHFTLSDVAPGTYTFTVKGSHTLANARLNVSLDAGIVNLDMGTLLEGDADNDNQINVLDFSILAATFGTISGQPAFDPRADFDNSGQINIHDFSMLAGNFGKFGDQIVPGS